MILTKDNKASALACKYENNSFSCYAYYRGYHNYYYYSMDSGSLIQRHYLTKLLPESRK